MTPTLPYADLPSCRSGHADCRLRCQHRSPPSASSSSASPCLNRLSAPIVVQIISPTIHVFFAIVLGVSGEFTAKLQLFGSVFSSSASSSLMTSSEFPAATSDLLSFDDLLGVSRPSPARSSAPGSLLAAAVFTLGDPLRLHMPVSRLVEFPGFLPLSPLASVSPMSSPARVPLPKLPEDLPSSRPSPLTDPLVRLLSSELFSSDEPRVVRPRASKPSAISTGPDEPVVASELLGSKKPSAVQIAFDELPSSRRAPRRRQRLRLRQAPRPTFALVSSPVTS